MKTLDETISDIEKGLFVQESALHYLKTLKAKNEEPPLGEPPDYIPLSFHQLAEMIGEPIYIKPDGCKGHWEILTSVKRDIDGDCFTYRGFDHEIRLTDEIYRTKEGAG